jgi:hypothetical protein
MKHESHRVEEIIISPSNHFLSFKKIKGLSLRKKRQLCFHQFSYKIVLLFSQMILYHL